MHPLEQRVCFPFLPAQRSPQPLLQPLQHRRRTSLRLVRVLEDLLLAKHPRQRDNATLL